MVLQIVRLVAVIALLGAAAAIATPKGRLPLALRGLAKLLRSRESSQPLNPSTSQPSAGKRALAFVLVLLAILLTLI